MATERIYLLDKSVISVEKTFDDLVNMLMPSDSFTFAKFSAALRAGQSVYKKYTVQSLKKHLKVRGYSRNSIRYHDIDKGIKAGRLTKYRRENTDSGGSDTYRVLMIHIMGDFRLKFFELGTKDRLTKKGYTRGVVKPVRFFSDVKNNPVVRELAYDAIINKLKSYVAVYLNKP